MIINSNVIGSKGGEARLLNTVFIKPRANLVEITPRNVQGLEFASCTISPTTPQTTRKVVDLLENYWNSFPPNERPKHLDPAVSLKNPRDVNEIVARILYVWAENNALQLIEGIRFGYNLETLNLGNTVEILKNDIHISVTRENGLKLLIPVQITHGYGSTSTSFYPFRLVAHSEFEEVATSDHTPHRLRIGMGKFENSATVKNSLTVIEYAIKSDSVRKLFRLSEDPPYTFYQIDDYGSPHFFRQLITSLQQAESFVISDEQREIKQTIESLVPIHKTIISPEVFKSGFFELADRNLVCERLSPDQITGSEVLYNVVTSALKALKFNRISIDQCELSVMEDCPVGNNLELESCLSLRQLDIQPINYRKLSVNSSSGEVMNYDLGHVAVTYAGQAVELNIIYDHQTSKIDTSYLLDGIEMTRLISFLNNSCRQETGIVTLQNAPRVAIGMLADIAYIARGQTVKSQQDTDIPNLVLQLDNLNITIYGEQVPNCASYLISYNDSRIGIKLDMQQCIYSCKKISPSLSKF